jgi:hypothetical protein
LEARPATCNYGQRLPPPSAISLNSHKKRSIERSDLSPGYFAAFVEARGILARRPIAPAIAALDIGRYDSDYLPEYPFAESILGSR